jgi:hypothetical protein
MTGTQPAYLTFEEYHAEPANNPFGLSEGDSFSGIAGVYAGWRVVRRPTNTKEDHLNILADFTSPVGAIGVFVQGGGSPTGLLQVLHGVQNFPGLSGLPGLPGRPSVDRRQTFAYLGEVVGIDAVTVAFNKECMGVTDSVIVPGTHDRVMQLLAVGPFPSTEANTRNVKTRAVIYIHFDLVSIVLGRDVSARQVYELLVPSIVANGLASTLKPLVDFFTIALVSTNGTAVTPVTVRDKLGLEWDINPALVGYRQEKIIYSVLPDLRPSKPSRGDPYVQDLVNGVKQFVTEMKDARIAGDDRRLDAARTRCSCSPTSRTMTSCPTSSMSWSATPREYPSAYYSKERWTLQLVPWGCNPLRSHHPKFLRSRHLTLWETDTRR